MTSSEERPATAAGVFVVRDPAVCAALEQLLAPHRTDTTDDGSAAIVTLMADAEARAAELTGEPTGHLPPDATVEQLLEHVDAKARLDGLIKGREQATAEGRTWSEEMQDRVRRAEAAVARAEREVENSREDLEQALAKIAELEVRPSGRRPTVSALRLKDQESFAALADRLDREAMSQTKTPAAVLRIASKAVRDELAVIYGNTERTAS